LKKITSGLNVHNIPAKRILANPALKARVDGVLNARRGGGDNDGLAGDSTRAAGRETSRPVGSSLALVAAPANNVDEVSTDSDAIDDPKEDEITADYLEALSRRALPNQDEIQWTDLDRTGRRIVTSEERRARRMGIYYLFTQVYRSVPEHSKLWDGQNGIVSRIRDALFLPKTTNLRCIRAIMRLILLYQARKLQYDGSAEARKEWTNYKVATDSYEAKVIADCMESGFGLDFMTWFVNLYRIEEQKEHIGRSTVYNTSLCLKPDVSAITKRPQGNCDPDSAFCQANYRWSTQLLLMYGELSQNEVPESFKDNDGNYPDCFQVDKLPKLKIQQIGWFDESHKKQKVGKMKNGKKIQMRFRRDAEGNLDPNGELAPKGYEVGMKYDKEARFCFGCVLELDDIREGHSSVGAIFFKHD
jgi:hypothetical protein